jgi:hypothetical protein
VTRKLYLALAAVMVAGLMTSCAPAQEDVDTPLDAGRQAAESFVRESPTFQFDGMEDTLKLADTLVISEPNSWTFVYEFDSRHAGYGDRIGMVLAQVITPHVASITVTEGEVVYATLDNDWDMLEQARKTDHVDPDDAVAPPPADLIGVVTGVEPVGRNDVLGLVHVESETDTSQKYVVTVTGETVLTGLDGETVGFDSFEETQEVRVWFSGPVKESFPMQVDAGKIVISRAVAE